MSHLNLGGNDIGEAGTESLFGVLEQFTTLTHLELSYNDIGTAGSERFAGLRYLVSKQLTSGV